MNEILGGLSTLLFSNSPDRYLLIAILVLLLLNFVRTNFLNKYSIRLSTLWKKYEEETNQELVELKKKLQTDEQNFLKDLKGSIDGLSYGLDMLKQELKHEYSSLKQQIGVVIKISDENAQEIDKLKDKLEKMEKEYNAKIHKIELKIAELETRSH